MVDTSDQKVTMRDLRKSRLVAGHKRLLSYSLETDTAPDDDMFAVHLRADLTDEERIRLIRLLLMTFPADLAEWTVQACFEDAGWPEPSLMDNPLSDARFWAQNANSNEIGAYARACFEEMHPKRKAGFAQWVQSKVNADG